MKYSIVIPTYNHCDDLLKPCIDSLIRNTDMSDIELIIVANGCTDNTREYVNSVPGNVILVWNDEPIGYTRATNRGIGCSTGDYILLLNNDVQILDFWSKNAWMNALTEPFIHDEKMAITGTVKYVEHSINREFLIFSCVLIKRQVFGQIGMLDEIFSPGYGEDIDFCLRAEEAGLKWLCVDNTTEQNGMHIGNFPIYHKGTATFGDQLADYIQVVARNKQTLIDRYNK